MKLRRLSCLRSFRLKSILTLLFLTLPVASVFAVHPFNQEHDEKPIELSGFSVSESYEISDDASLDLDAPILKKLLYRVKRTSPETRNKYSQYSRDVSWRDIHEQTSDYRLWVFDRPARLLRIEKHRFQNTTQHEEIKGVYVCHCELPASNDSDSSDEFSKRITVLSRTVPSSLSPDSDLDEPIRITGFLYGRTSRANNSQAQPEDAHPVFVTDGLAWYPTQSSANASTSLTQLAKHGLDIGLLDSVRQNNTKPLGSKDAEAFFQFISAVKKMESSSAPQGESKLGFVQIMQNANANFGHFAHIQGVVRTCSVIPIQHSDIRERLGVTEYYQLMLFPDLDGAKVVINSKDGEQLDYRKFPVTVCCTELPPGMQPKDIEKKQFDIEGYFFRFWKYQSDKTDAVNASGQVSPLIMAKLPVEIPTKANQLNWILTIFVVTLIAGTAILLWTYRVADRKRETPDAEILSSLPDRIDLAGIDES